LSDSLVFIAVIFARQRSTTQNRRSALDPTLVFSCRVVSSCGFLSVKVILFIPIVQSMDQEVGLR
jgi:hypothetical protein